MTFSKAVPIFKFFGIFCVLVISVLSLLTGSSRPHTGYSGNFEHIVTYFGASLLLWLGFGKKNIFGIVLGLSIASGIFEILQIWIPGRSAGIDNWASSTAGAIAGVVVGFGIIRAIRLETRNQ